MSRGGKPESDQAARVIEPFLRRVRRAGRKDPQIDEIVRELRSHLDTIWNQSHSIADLQAAIVDFGEPWQLAGDATALAAAWRTVWILFVCWPLAIWRLFRSPIIPRPLAVAIAGLVILPAILFFSMAALGVGATTVTVTQTTLYATQLHISSTSTPAAAPKNSTAVESPPVQPSAPGPNWPLLAGLLVIGATIGPDLTGLPFLGSIILAVYLWKSPSQKSA